MYVNLDTFKTISCRTTINATFSLLLTSFKLPRSSLGSNEFFQTKFFEDQGTRVYHQLGEYAGIPFYSKYTLYTALHVGQTNQWRPQRDKSQGKGLKSRGRRPQRIRKQIFAEKQFHNRGPAEANIRCFDVDVLERQTITSLRYRERSGRTENTESGRIISLQRQLGAKPRKAIK